MGVEREAALQGGLADGQQRARVPVVARQPAERVELAGVGQAGREVGAQREREVAQVGLVQAFQRLARGARLSNAAPALDGTA